MGLFGPEKTDEEKALEAIAKALDGMVIREKDGMVHAGCFELNGLMGYDRKSTVFNGVLEYLQKEDREIVDVLASGTGGGNGVPCQMVTILYR